MDWNTVVDGKQEWDRDIKFGGVPQNAVVLKRPENIFQGLAPYFFWFYPPVFSDGFS